MFRAKLDSSGLFLGLEEVKELLDSDIELGEDCGLKAGKYRWDGKTFLPLPKSQQKAAPDVPSYEQALYALIKDMKKPPAECLEWAKWYETTIGAR